jgi:limonene-1,2-epoxide hydrolase
MSQDNGQIVHDFVSLFTTKDVTRLAPFLHPDIEFQAYGDAAVHGREAVLKLWGGVFDAMGEVAFTTIHQAVNGDIVLEEQVHGLALPGKRLAEIMNMAVYRLQDGLIVEWRDYTNPEFARTLMQAFA